MPNPGNDNYQALRDQNRITVATGQSNTDSSQTLPFLINFITGRVMVDATGGISSINVTDGVTTVAATTIDFTSGATVTDGGGGTANVAISGGGGGTPGGLNTQLQYNNAGSFGGITGAVTDGTAVSLTAPHLLNPTINGAGTGLATLAYPNTASSATITFPTVTGTLATLAGTEALTNKSINGVTLVNGGTSTLYLSQGGTYTTPAGTYVLPTASTSVLGGVKVDGTSITISGGVISATTGGSGTVTSVASADSSITVTNPTTTVDLAVVKAPIWTTARLLAGNSVNGSANVAFANKFIVQGTTDTGLSGAQFLGALGTGIVKNTTATGVLSIAVAADFPTLNQNTTGSAATLTTPRTIGIATGDATSAGSTFDGSANNTNALTLATVNSNVGSFGSATAAGTFTVNGKGLITAASNTTITPAVGSITGLGTGIATFLVTPSSANLATAVTDETGSGALVFANTPTLVTAILGSSTATTQAPGDSSTKVATTAYVDAAILGTDFKEAAKYATTAALPSLIYSNGSSGVGATLTGVSVGALSVDGSTPSVADRILVKNQVSTFQNGIYVVTTVGSGIAVFVLTRSTDFNQSAEIDAGDAIFVTAGTANTSTTWAYNGISSPTMGTDAITFAQISGPGSITSGNGITVTGLSVAIDTSVTVDKTTAQTLTNKSISATQLTGTLQAGQFPALTGDLTTSAGALATTLATVNSNVGSFTNANITVNAKGLITAAANGTASSGTVNSGTAAQMTWYAGTGTTVSGNANVVYATSGANAQLSIGVPNTTVDIGQIRLSYTGGVSDGYVILSPASGLSGNVTLTLPNATDTLVGKATTDTLTNKTLTSPVLTTPTLGVATGTSLALGGATIGTDALAWTGTATGSGALSVGNVSVTTNTLPTNGLYLSTTNTLGFVINGAREAQINSTDFSPGANAGNALGTGSLGWNGLFLAGTTAVTWGNSYTLTHSSGLLTTNGNLSLTTSGVLTTGTIELGAASDTTLSRVSAGVIAVEGVDILTASNTETVTNKRITRRLVTTTQAAAPAINTDNTDISNIAALAQAITSMSTNLTGTPVDGDQLEIRITDSGTARAIAWGASFAATTVGLPTTTVVSTMLRVYFERSGSTWNCVGVV